jgi:hypothetical protein
MTSFAHVISPFIAKPGSEWEIAQRITIETMRQAKAATAPQHRVTLLATVFPEDAPAVPQGFERTNDLSRSVLDIRSFRVPKKLPLLRDILANAVAATDAEYMVYTNADIGLQPDFYDAIARHIDKGLDALVINRRTIGRHWSEVSEIPQMLKDRGRPHPGFDCFVFRRDAFPRFILGNVCLGSSHVDLPFIASLIATAKNFRLFRDEYLTFHIGDSMTWMKLKVRDYRMYNDNEACKAVRQLCGDRFPGIIPSLMLNISIPHNATIVRGLLKAFNQVAPRSERLVAERKDVVLEAVS